MSLVVLVLAVLVGLGWLVRGRTYFHLSVRDGRVLVVRGRVPPGFLEDVRRIVRSTDRGSIRVVDRADGVALVCRGLDEGTAQRLRNTWRLVSPAALAHAPPIRRPTPGQVLGIAWLAWWFEPSRRRDGPREIG